MTETEFFPYHNRHIKFKQKNGNELTGVLIDATNMKNRTLYTFVTTNNMAEWRKAFENNDDVTRKKLEGQFDIKDIDSAELLD